MIKLSLIGLSSDLECLLLLQKQILAQKPRHYLQFQTLEICMCVCVCFGLRFICSSHTPSSSFNSICSHVLSRCKQRSTGPNIIMPSLFPCTEATLLYMKAFITDVAVVCRNSITHEHSVNFGTGRHSVPLPFVGI